MRAPAGPARREVLTGLAAGLAGAALPGAVVGAPAAASTTAPAPAPAGDALPLRVAVLEVTPVTYAAQDPARSVVTVRARVRHGGGEALQGLRARLVAQRSPVVARSGLDRWESADPGASLGRTAVSSAPVNVGALPPGGAVEVVLSLEAAALGDGEGAHPAAVEVLTASGRRAGLARTFLVSSPVGVRTTLLTLLLPLVAGRVRTAGELAEVGAGRLARLLEASGDPRTSWALDPAVLATAPVPAPAPAPATAGTPGASTPGGDDDGTALPAGAGDPVGTGAALAAWRERLAAAATGRCVVVLPHGDPDLASLSAVPAGADLLAAAAGAGAGAGAALGRAERVLAGVAWPADESADAAVLSLAAAGGATTVVLDDRSLPTPDELTYTPTGRAVLDVGTGAGAGALEAVVADSALSALLARAGVGAAGAAGEGAAALVQRVVAEVATVTLQRPSDPRSLLVVAPRSFDPRPEVVGRLVAAVEGSGWASWQPLPQLLATPVPDVERGEVPARAAASARGRAAARATLPAAHLAAVEESLTALDGLRAALEGPAPAPGAVRRSALLLLGASWRGHPDELRGARAGVQEDVAALLGAVHVLPGSVLNLAATRTELPVTVVNGLSAPARVELLLRPRSPRVQLSAVPVQTVPPGGQVRVGVPVRALANGSVVVEARLRTPSGLLLGEPVGLDVNVRADVEGWLTGLVGGGAAALLVAGLVRAVRRGERRVDAAPHADVGGPEPDPGPVPGAGGGAARDEPHDEPHDEPRGRRRPSAPTGQG
ncbi:DUF6049 family protein [Kineococcus gypseus]|uniref:DUF6049 family protein n=1 Tax=Kineococcus gypseus TaxID=1637102 RepID=UPI003D7D05DA